MQDAISPAVQTSISWILPRIKGSNCLLKAPACSSGQSFSTCSTTQIFCRPTVISRAERPLAESLKHLTHAKSSLDSSLASKGTRIHLIEAEWPQKVDSRASKHNSALRAYANRASCCFFAGARALCMQE